MASNTSKAAMAMQSIGDYDLVERIAEGGMGVVYKARHRQSGQIVAIKVVPPHLATDPILRKRFENEFRAANSLDHPNIVRALEYGETGGSPYLVMEYVEGESLGQRLAREGRMPESEAIRIVAQVAQGLHRAHRQGLIHRDVKPDNILLTPDGQVKLADLGLVKEVETDLNLTRTGRGLGTPHFMAPEQFRNAKNADARYDIYSLGATLYMMVTGELPFRSCGPLDAWMKKVNNELTPPRKLAADLTERIDWAIRRAMSADPDQRPATCREFVEDLTGHSTRRIPTAEISAEQELWYLVYKDDEGVTHTVKGTAAAIRRSLKEGLLGDASNLRASRTKTGVFEPLRTFPEFRDLVVSPAAIGPARGGGGTSPTALSAGRATNPGPADTEATLPLAAHSPSPRPGNGEPHLDPVTGIPHIEFERNSPQALEWLKSMAILTVVAVTTAIVALIILLAL
jgi:serine/threonine protein kinase